MYCWSESLDGTKDSQKCVEQLQLIDNCNFPNCNPTCPKARDEFNGRAISPLQYFEKIDALNLDTLAKEVKVDRATLLNYDNKNYNKFMRLLITLARKKRN